jgi:hypothetical protein
MMNPTVPIPIRNARLWLNAFIAQEVKTAGGAIPGPLNIRYSNFDDCFLTDQRTFQASPKDASSRIHAEVLIDFTGAMPALQGVGLLGATVNTIRIRASTGEVLNEQGGIARGGFVKASGFQQGSHKVSVAFKIAGANPVAKMPSVVTVTTSFLPPSKQDPQAVINPDINMEGSFWIDAKARTLVFEGKIDGFPFFEGYVAVDGGRPHTLFREAPLPGVTPASGLFGSPKRPVHCSLSL